MDTVRFKDDVVGRAPITEAIIEVREGTEGVVTRIDSNGFFIIEVPNVESMIPRCFVEVDIGLISRVTDL